MSDRLKLRTILMAAVTHRWLILVPAVLCFSAAAIATTFQDDIYESQAILLAPMAEPSDGLIRKAVIATANDMLRASRERMQAFDFLSRVVRDLDLYPELRAEKGLEEAVNELRKNLSIRVDPRSRALQVSVRHKGGEHPADIAAKTANYITDLFVEEQRHALSQKAVDVKSFLEKEEARLLKELVQAERAIENFKASHLGELPEDRATNQAIIAQAQARVELCLDRQIRNRDEIDRYTVSSFELEQKLQLADRELEPGGSQAEVFRQVIGTLEARIANDITVYQPESSHIQTLKAQIAEAKKRLDEILREARGQRPGNGGIKDFYRWLLDTHRKRQEELRRDSKLCQERIAEAKKTIDAAQARIEAAARLESQYAALQRAVDDARDRRKMLLARRQEAAFAVSFQDHDPTAPVEIEQRAFASDKPVGPARLATALAGLLAGFGLGIALTFARVKLTTSLGRGDELRALMPGAVVITLPDLKSPGMRVGSALLNVAAALILLVVAGTSFAILGIRMGWWGDPGMLSSLLDLKLPL